MKHLGLFEGIGGFSLAARWMGWDTVAWCEWNPFCQTVLRHHFPEAHGHGDITKTNFTRYANRIDILTGGFPCQPFSVAGKREGSGDDRFLWPATLRALEEIQPTYAIFENVFGLTSILESACETDVELQAVKLFSEGCDGDEVEERITEVKRRTISIIIDQIEEVGYTLPKAADGTPIVLCVPACAVNAPHRRDRVWFIARNTQHNGPFAAKNGGAKSKPQVTTWAYKVGQLAGTDSTRATHACNPERKGLEGGDRFQRATGFNAGRKRSLSQFPFIGSLGEYGDTANAKRVRQSGQGGSVKSCGCQAHGNWKASWAYDDGRWPTESPICSRNDGLPAGLSRIAVLDLLKGRAPRGNFIPEAKHRNESLKAYGNAIVPQVAHMIFKALEEI